MATAGAVMMAAEFGTAIPRSADAQPRDVRWAGRTLWGDPDLQGEWTSEGEYGVPFERPPQFGTRQVLD